MRNKTIFTTGAITGALLGAAILGYNTNTNTHNKHPCEGKTPTECAQEMPVERTPQHMQEFEDELAPGRTIFDEWQANIEGVVDTTYNVSEAVRHVNAPFFYEVNKAAHECDFSVPLAYAVMKQESDFDPRAVSRTGATGLMQLTAGTAGYMGVNDRNDVEENIRGGVCYLARLRDHYNIEDLDLLLASYNAGPGAVRRAPGETFEEKRGSMGSQADVFVPLVRGTLEEITRASREQIIDRSIIDEAHRLAYNDLKN